MKYDFLFALLLIISFTSCGYTATEEDKYPNMAIFPNVDGKGMSLKKERVDYNSLYLLDNRVVTIDYQREGGYAYLLLLDRGYNIIDSIKLGTRYHHISDDGFIYYENESNTYSKIHYLTREIIDIPPYPIDTKGIYEKKLDSIKVRQLTLRSTHVDSLLLNEEQQIILAYKLSIKELEEIVLPGLLCTRFIDADSYVEDGYSKGAFIVQYLDEEFSLPQSMKGYKSLVDAEDYYNITSKKISDKAPVCQSVRKFTINYSTEDSTMFTVFDKVVMKNGSGGNHFVFSYSPIFYRYVELKYKEEKVKFKIYNKQLETFYSPDSTALIITDRDREMGYYRVVLD